MQKNNQRIIFEVSENTTPAKMIIAIMKKNEIVDTPYENLKASEKPKLAIISDIIKDFVINSFPEEKLSELLQTQLQITKEKSTNLLKDLKKELIPFTKKITVTEDTVVSKTKNNSEVPSSFVKKPPAQTSKGKSRLPQKKIEEVETEKIKKPIQQINHRTGPDSYREPI